MNKTEMAEVLSGIVAESNSRPPAFISPKCNQCRRHKRGTMICEAHPQGIPKAIITGKENCQVFKQK